MNAGEEGRREGRGGERAELEKDLARLESEHLEVLKAGLSVPGGIQFSQRLHELEEDADRIRVRLGIPPRGGTADRALGRPSLTARFGGEGELLVVKHETGHIRRWVGILVGIACAVGGIAVGLSDHWPLTSVIVTSIGAATFGAHVVMLLLAARHDRQSRF